MTYPKISIVTPVYNQAKYLEETILSILNQGYPNLEYIIIDGGSIDGTIDVIKKYEKHLAYWVTEPDKGMYDAIQKGFEHSTGEIMCWLNADDVFFDKCLFAIADVFTNHPEVEWLSGKSATLDEQGMIVGVTDINEINFTKYDAYLNPKFWIPQASTIWRRSIWAKIGGRMGSNLRLAGDFDLWLRFNKEAPRYLVDTLIGSYRVREGQLSQMKDKYMFEVAVSIKNNPLSSKDMAQLKKYAYRLKLAERIGKLKIFAGKRLTRLNYFIGVHNLKPGVIRYNHNEKHF